MKIGRNEPCPCGSGLKYKKCCASKEEARGNLAQKDALSSGKQSIQSSDQIFQEFGDSGQKQLMKTVTGEIYQPVRLYYKVHNKHAIQNSFRKLRCMDFDGDNDRWVWLYYSEARKIVFPKPYNQISKAAHPIVIGSFFTKVDDEMHLDVRSIERAVEAVLFFDKHIDRSFARVTHIAVLNRLPFDNPRSPRINFDEFFNDGNIEEINSDQEFENLINLVSEDDDVNVRQQKAFTHIMQKMSQGFPEAEKFSSHYYEEGIDQIRRILTHRQAVAIERWGGKEDVTSKDIFQKILGPIPDF